MSSFDGDGGEPVVMEEEEGSTMPNDTEQRYDSASAPIATGSSAAAAGSETEEDNEEDDDEEEEDQGETTYKLRFEGEMNPLDFIDADDLGVQPFQQFERLENGYEDLAAKKRKATSNDSEILAKKVRHEDIPGANFDEIMEAIYGRRRKSKKTKKRGRRRGSKNKTSPEVAQKLGDANMHYAIGRYKEAISVLKEVILLSPNLPDAYHTLGLVYDSMGERKKAMYSYMLAARMTPKNPHLWRRLFKLSIEEGNIGRAISYLSKAITADPQDIVLRYDRASLYAKLGDDAKAAESYEQISQLCPRNVEALKTASKIEQFPAWLRVEFEDD